MGIEIAQREALAPRSPRSGPVTGLRQQRSTRATLTRMWFYRYVYLLMLPGLLFFFVFHYIPMWGIVIAFQDFRLWQGLLGSPWVGFANFEHFFTGPYFWRLMRNTLLISGLNLVFVFPSSIILALLLNEVRSRFYKRAIQTVSYFPHFISWVVIGGLLIYLFSVNVGFVTNVLGSLGWPPLKVLGSASAFLPLVVLSNIWKEIGWGAIIYLAAIAGVNQDLYEAATVDGANRFQRALYVTIPSIAPVIIIMLILRVGQILNVNFQQILILVGNDGSLFEVGDVIDTWVYRAAFFQQQMSMATAVGLFKGLIGLALVWFANRMANRFSEGGLWS
jgi:putative aldouronate transport system permease protein